MEKYLKITQTRSGIGRLADQKATLVALGIHKRGHTVIHRDTPQIRGMINKIKHLLVWEEFTQGE